MIRRGPPGGLAGAGGGSVTGPRYAQPPGSRRRPGRTATKLATSRLRIYDVSITGGAPAGRDGESAAGRPADQLGALLGRVARGDESAYEAVYDRAAGRVLGIVRAVVRDPAQSEEVAQEVLLDIWRTASRFDPALGSGAAWVTTLAHRRAVDRVRSEQKAAEREMRAASANIAYDEVVEAVEARLDRERVRRCLGSLTPLQRESVTLAYYSGYTYREVGALLGVAVGTVKTRMRDGLIRLRDCLGVDQ
jgi:RNA polymerase sigma-70 factor, ECF subfamily